MKDLRGDQGANVAGIFGHGTVFGAALRHFAIWRARAANVARVPGGVASFGVQRSGDGGR